MGQLTWEPIGANEPRSPYAHWWWREHIGSDGRLRAPGGDTIRWLRLQHGPLAGPEKSGAELIEALQALQAEISDELEEDLGADAELIPILLPEDVINPAFRKRAGTRHVASPLDLRAPPSGSTIVAVIDDGIAFAHERFRRDPHPTHQPRTRFDYVWLQGARRPELSGVAAEHLPTSADLPFGRALDATEIDALLAEHWRNGRVDEESLYRRAGLIDFSRGDIQSAAMLASHGTAVADQAAGFDPGEAGGDRITLIGVALPSSVTHDTTGTFLDVFVALALKQIFLRVAQMKTARKDDRIDLIINFSYALTAGPKDGSTLVDRLVRQASRLLEAGPAGRVTLVMPAGNHRQSQTHARLTVPHNGASEWLTWRVLPDDGTASFVEIWLEQQDAPPDAPTVFADVIPPHDAPFDAPPPPDPLPYRQAWPRAQFTDLGPARVYYSWHPLEATAGDGIPSGPGRQRIIVAIPPTAPGWPGQVVGPAGDWRIRLRAAVDELVWELAAELFIQRDDTPLGYRHRGRQSYFVDPRYDLFDVAGRPLEFDWRTSPVTRVGTLNAYATGRSRSDTTVVGAYSYNERRQMPYSGLGHNGMLRSGPDLVACADISRIQRGLLCAATFSGGRVAVSGTSIAAPRITRIHAMQLAGLGPPKGQPASGFMPIDNREANDRLLTEEAKRRLGR